MSLSSYSLLFLALYLGCCLAAGVTGLRGPRKPVDDFICGRKASTVPVALSIAIVSLASIGFIEHLALIRRDGLPYAAMSLFVVVIPLSGAFLLTRQWMVARRFGYVTPGEMYAGYFRSRAIRLITVFIALVFAIPFVAAQLAVAGAVAQLCFDNWLSAGIGTVLFAAILLGYVVTGGSRGVTLMGAFQFLFFVVGMVLIGWIVVDQVGGVNSLLQHLAEAGNRPDHSIWGRTNSGHNALLSSPGIVSIAEDRTIAALAGGPWSSLMVLTYLLSLLGIQASPALSMSAYSIRKPAAVTVQAMWLMPVVGGVLCIFIAAAVGLGGNFLPDSSLVSSPQTSQPFLPGLPDGELWTALNDVLATVPRWMLALTAVCFLALLHAACALYVWCASAMFARDVVQAMFAPDISHQRQVFIARVSALIICALATLFALLIPADLAGTGRLAISFSLQLLPAIVGVCWVAWFSGRAVLYGLVVSLMVVLVTDQTGLQLLHGLLRIDLPWQYWPLGINAAIWGLVVNISLVVAISTVTQSESSSRHRERVHRFLNEYATKAPRRSRRMPNAWTFLIIWFAFAVGPGAILGNRVFGDPAAGTDGWRLLLPSLWAWQIVWWMLGVALMWYLVFGVRLTDNPIRQVDPLVDDATDAQTRS